MVCAIFQIISLTRFIGEFVFGDANVFLKSYSNNSCVFSRGKKYSRAWCSWSIERLSLFLSLYTFWYETCTAKGAAFGSAFFSVHGFTAHGFFDEDEHALYWALFLETSAAASKCLASLLLSLALLLRLFKWIWISCAFVDRSLNPSKVYGISTVERSCLKLFRHIRTSSC